MIRSILPYFVTGPSNRPHSSVKHTRRPYLEELEQRELLSGPSIPPLFVDIWIGGGGDNYWETGKNWLAGRSPGPGDAALIPGRIVPGKTNITVTVKDRDTISVASLTLSGGATLQMGWNSTVTVSQSLRITSSTIAGGFPFLYGAVIRKGAIVVPKNDGSDVEVSTIFNNNGNVRVQLQPSERGNPNAGAELELREGGNEPGRFSVEAQAKLTFIAGQLPGLGPRSYQLGPFSTFGGDGSYEVRLGAHLVLGGSTLRVKHVFLGESAPAEKSFIEGKGLLVPDELVWEDGTIKGINVVIERTGTLKADVSAVAISEKNLVSGLIYCLGTMWIDGTLTLSGLSIITLDGSNGGGALIVNNQNQVRNKYAKIERIGSLPFIALLSTGEIAVVFGKGTIEVPIIDTLGKFKLPANGVLELPLGLKQTNGEVSLSGGEMDASQLSLIGGEMDGMGIINAPVQESGSGTVTLSPGILGMSGRISINGSDGNLGLDSSGILNIKVGGYGAGSGFDQISVNSSASLNGTLNISLINGFNPNVGDSFQVMTYGSYTSTFQTVTGAVFASGTKRFVLQYNATNLTLTVVANSAVAAPTVTSLGTTTGTTAGGTSVTINGSNFMDSNSKSLVTSVGFGSTPASSFTVNSATSITATAPPEAVGTVDVRVTTVNGTSASCVRQAQERHGRPDCDCLAA
jgi:hypothetical protein